MSSHKLVLCLAALSVASPALAQTHRKVTGKGAVLVSPPAPADVKIRAKYVSGAQVSENTAYFKGMRQRFEFPGIAMITQCDLKRTLQLNQATRQYLVVPAEALGPGSAPNPPAAPPLSQPPAGVVTETTTLTDTGERKQMFELEARHIKTVIIRQPGENACDSAASRIEIDGWYVDLPDRAACPAVPTPAAPPDAAGAACHDRIETRQVGAAKVGFALSTAITTITEEGKDVRTTSMEVTDLQVTSLEAALFDVPPGYTQVKSYGDLVPALSGGGSLADVVFGSLADGTSTLAPKKPGVIRIGIVDPANKSGQPMPTALFRGGLIASLSKAPFEALRVGGATPDDIDHDATQKACDFVLLAEVTELKASKPGKVGGLLRRASGDLNAPSEVHDARVDYKLYAVGSPGKPRLAGTAKASSGGGFGVGSALKVAKFAGSLYLGMSGRLMGGMGMMGPYASLMGSGGGLKTRLMSPGMGAALSMMSQAPTVGHPDSSNHQATQTVEQAFAKASRQVADELKKSKP